MGQTDEQSCNVGSCDRTWDRHPILEISCPSCDADVGERCKRPSGHDVQGKHGRFHNQRYYDALDADHFGECPLDRCPESSEQSKQREQEKKVKSKRDAKQTTLPV